MAAIEFRRQKLQIAIGADHAGYNLKCFLVERLQILGHDVIDLGAYTLDPSDDFPDFAGAVAKSVSSGAAHRGVVICGSGVGASVAANKVRGVRASVCHDTYSAHQGVEHDDMNVLCLGARIVEKELAEELLRIFVAATFKDEGRYRRRLDKVLAIENEYGGPKL